MYSLQTSTSTYNISLDHIDLKTIRRRLGRNDVGMKPLWTVPRNNEDYRRFELIARNTGNSNSSECNGDTAEYPTVTCYICNINIPSNYIIDHNNSEKHKLCLKIADTALQRVKDQMLMDDTQSTATESVSGYFCEPCSMIVTNEHHENTEIHKSSTLHDKLLKDLLMIYIDRDNINNIDLVITECMNKEDSEEDIKHRSDTKNNNLNTDDAVKNKTVNSQNKKEISVHDENMNDYVIIDKDNAMDNDVSSISNYIKFLTEIFPGSSVEYKYTHNKYVQVNVSGYKKLLRIDNFLGIDRGSNMCLMCTKQSIEGSILVHIHEFEHMTKVMAPVNDQDCIRQINAVTYYCMLCAYKITEGSRPQKLNYDYHVRSKRHLMYAREALIKTSDDVTSDVTKTSHLDEGAATNDNNKVTMAENHKENTKKIFCRVCSVYVNSVDMGKHCNEPAHKFRSGTLPNEDTTHTYSDESYSMSDTDNSSVSSDESVKVPLNYQMRTTSNPKAVRCKVCNVIVPNTIHNIIDHTTGRNHKLKYNEHLTMNNIKLVDNRFFCELCNVPVTLKNELEHISGTRHQSKVSADKQNDPVNIVTPNATKDNQINNEIEAPNVTKDNQNNNEIKAPNVTKDNQNHNEIEAPAKCVNKTYCDICAVHVDTHNYNGHIKGGKHKQMAAASAKMTNVIQTFAQAAQSKPVQPPTQTNNDLKSNVGTEQNTRPKIESQVPAKQSFRDNIELNTNTVPENFLYQMLATDNVKKLFCRICKVNVPNIIQDVKMHANGCNHRYNYTTFLTSNKMKKNGDNFKCDACKVTVTRRNEIDHILGRNHHANMKKKSDEN